MTDLLRRLLRRYDLPHCPAIIGPSEPGGLGIVLGADPAIRFCQRGITAAPLQVIDADISGEAGAGGKLTLDAAIRRHRRLVRKQYRPNLAILVGPARRAQQGAVLSPAPEFLRGDKAAFPKPPPGVLFPGLLPLESSSPRRVGTPTHPPPPPK